MTAAAPAAPAASTDRIEEHVVLRQPRARVWRALTTAEEFGAWFGVRLSGGTFAPGAHVRAQFTIPGYEYVVFDVLVGDVVPEERFSWRWHPHAVERGADYSAETRTLVEFALEDTADGGTLLRVTESGFDALPEARRATALAGNTGGWTSQLRKRLVAYLDG
ncbi:SRPBCC family protein [Roseisolibacter sp. H3M3-2]|uniref:SRPBCC family protein n=1 Tax=Roseisolibacter sp. H3M3-2 TaxID=3031323 RepID=UPI0023DB3622|nr:SRPBCC family protein [Roseisolibacter sp. H3M3-2]MDF1504218.1 SRPBCC family protein [Roseisolibacter sp. H3M3-2]